MILKKKINPMLVFRLSMVALIVASLGQRFLDPNADFAKGALYGVAIAMMLLAVVLMRGRRPSCGAAGS